MNPLKKNKFIIITTGRSGSTLLRLWLNSQKEFRVHGEIFASKSQDSFTTYARKGLIRKCIRKSSGDHSEKFRSNFVSNRFVHHYFQSLFNNPLHSAPWATMNTRKKYLPQTENEQRARLIGFKLAYAQYRYYQKVLIPILKKNHFKVVILERPAFDVALSFLEAKRRGFYHSENEYEKNTKFYIDKKEFLDCYSTICKEQRHIKENFEGYDKVNISYEAFISDINEREKLLDFLGATSKKLNLETIPIKKLSPEQRAERIINYSEIHQIFKDSQTSNFFPR